MERAQTTDPVDPVNDVPWPRQISRPHRAPAVENCLEGICFVSALIFAGAVNDASRKFGH